MKINHNTDKDFYSCLHIRIKTCFFAIAALLAAASAHAMTTPFKDQETANRSTTPDAIYKLLRHSYTLNENGTVDYNYRKEVTILRNHALTAYAWLGESFITYNPAFETLNINECYTIRPDGSKVEMPKAGYIEQLPSCCTDCGRYNNLRELAIVHTGMEIGCTIVLDYTIHRKSDKIFVNFTLAEDCPVERYEVDLSIPKDAQIEWGKQIVTHDNVSQQVSDDSLHIHWVAANLPQKYSDHYLPSDDQLYNSIHIRSGQLCDWFTFDNQEKLPEAKMIISNYGDNNRVVNAYNIANYVVSNVATNDIPPEALNYVISPACVTWQSNCGTPSDKTQLLCAMLRQDGYDATAQMEQGSTCAKLNILGKEYKLSANHMNVLPNDDNEVQADIQKNTQRPKDDSIYLGGGYVKWVLPQQEMKYDACYLASNREAPLALEKTVETDLSTWHHSLNGAKLVTKPYDIYIESKTRLSDGTPLWSMHVTLEQHENSINTTRIFTINDSRTISGKEYNAFRTALIEYQSTNEVIIKK